MSTDDSHDRTASETVYLELSDGQSHKFYEVTVIETLVTIRYGRIGTPGQSSDNTYATPEKAQAEATKKINEKLRKGYVHVPLGGDRSTSTDQLLDSAISPTNDEVSSRTINLADLPIEMSGNRSTLKLPLQRSLVAVELTAICNQPTFTINLRIDSNIAYHFDVRSHQKQVVQNTCITGGWGAEEHLPIPVEFTSSQPFTLRIAVEQTLVVYLNGQILSRYAHRLTPTQINTIEVSYLSDNLQVQSMQLFEQIEGEIAEPTDNFPRAATDDPTQNPELTAVPSPLAIDPTIPPPSNELLHKAVRGPTFLPRVTQNHWPSVRYPLGFVFFERQSYDLTIPLARSLVCFEMVGTLVNMDFGGFTLYLAANHETYYHCEFHPHEGHIAHWVRVRGESSLPERISIPSTIASGQIFHYVLTITESNIIAYLNNHPVFHNPRPQPFDPPDTLHLNYNPSGLRLQLSRVLEPVESAMQTSRPNDAIATPVPPSPQTTETQVAIAGSPLLETLPSQFEPLRLYIEAKLQSYIKIDVGEEVQWLNSAWSGDPLEPWQSKIGGFPYLPKGTNYPTDRETGEMMLFLMQINCADLPIIDGLALPRQGILQFYSGLNVPMCEVSPEQHRILYFPEVSQDRNDLITDFGFLIEYAEMEEWYNKIYPLAFSAHQDLFWMTRASYAETLNIPEELKTLSEEFMAWLDEADNQEMIDRRVNKLGGEVEFHSYVDETVGEAEGTLLLELNHPCDYDDYFYFFIEAGDLGNLDFSKVESYFMRV